MDFSDALAVALSLLALAVIDWRHLMLPDSLTLPLIPAGLAVAWTKGPERLLEHGLAALGGGLFIVAVALIYRRLRGDGVTGEAEEVGPRRARPAGSPAGRPSDEPLVDLVIALHSPEREVARAVRSVLDGSPEVDVRVSVVAHDLPAGPDNRPPS